MLWSILVTEILKSGRLLQHDLRNLLMNPGSVLTWYKGKEIKVNALADSASLLSRLSQETKLMNSEYFWLVETDCLAHELIRYKFQDDEIAKANDGQFYWSYSRISTKSSLYPQHPTIAQNNQTTTFYTPVVCSPSLSSLTISVLVVTCGTGFSSRSAVLFSTPLTTYSSGTCNPTKKSYNNAPIIAPKCGPTMGIQKK